MWSIFLYLVCVALILYAAYWVTKKRAGMIGGSFNPGGKKLRMELLSQMQVGANERVLVVETAGRYFLLGATSGGISLLAEFSEEEINAWKDSEVSDPEKNQGFFSAFMEMEMKKKHR